MPRKLPTHARSFSQTKDLYRHFEVFHAIPAAFAGDRRHELKKRFGYAAADDLLIGRSEDLYDPVTREWVGSLTEGGPRRI